MAERRMFTMQIIDSDAFLDLPLSSQVLYFHLNMRADDDGFINNPKKIQRMIGASDDDLKLLLAKRFILAFDNGVIVIKHWRMHNLLRKDRYTPTQYQEQFQTLQIKENGAYTEATNLLEADCQPDGNQMATVWQPNGNQMATQYSVGKDRIGKDSNNIGENSANRFVPPTLEDVQAYCDERQNGIDAQAFIDFYSAKGWMIGRNKMKDFKAAVRTWEKRRQEKNALTPRQYNDVNIEF